MKKAIAIFFIICFGVMILIESNVCSLCNPAKEGCPFNSPVAEETASPSCASSCASPCGTARPAGVSPCGQRLEQPSACSGCSSRQKKTYTTPCGKVIEIESEEAEPRCSIEQDKSNDSKKSCVTCPLYDKSGGCPVCLLSKLNTALTFQVAPGFKLMVDPNFQSTVFGNALLSIQQLFTIQSSGVHPTISSTVLRC